MHAEKVLWINEDEIDVRLFFQVFFLLCSFCFLFIFFLGGGGYLFWKKNKYCKTYGSYNMDSKEIKRKMKHKETYCICIFMTGKTKYTYICLGDDNFDENVCLVVQASNCWLHNDCTHSNKHGWKNCVQFGRKNG